MNLIIKGRQQGKTCKLIIASEVTGFPILVSDSKRKVCLEDIAKEMGCYIPEPITYEYHRRHSAGFHGEILIDDAEKIIEKSLENTLGCKVVAVTITDRSLN